MHPNEHGLIVHAPTLINTFWLLHTGFKLSKTFRTATELSARQPLRLGLILAILSDLTLVPDPPDMIH